jgi:ABC-2 type transport system permease protein
MRPNTDDALVYARHNRGLPIYYAISSLIKVMVLVAGIPSITTELSVLIIFGAVMIAIAMPVFKKVITR